MRKVFRPVAVIGCLVRPQRRSRRTTRPSSSSSPIGRSSGPGVLVTNEQTARPRGLSSSEGSASFPALSLTGRIPSRDEAGLQIEPRRPDPPGRDRTVKEARSAPRRPRSRSWHNKGVRADAQIGVSLDSKTMTRRRSSPQGDDAAAPQLGVPPGQGHRRPLRHRYFITARRTTTYMPTARATTKLGPPDDADDGPLAPQEAAVDQRVLGRVRLTAGLALTS